MRTWTVNGQEMVQLVYEAELDDVLYHPTQECVGAVACCRNEAHSADLPFRIDAVGTICHVAPEGKQVALIAPTGSKHPDGETGEVFVLYAYLRKKHKQHDLPSLCVWQKHSVVVLSYLLGTSFAYSFAMPPRAPAKKI